MEIYAGVQPLGTNTSSLSVMGNEPVTILPLDEENNENQINNGKETENICIPPNNDVEFDMPDVQVPVPNFDNKDYFTVDS